MQYLRHSVSGQARIDETHDVPGSVMGPYPFPEIVRDFQAVISKEIKAQLMKKEEDFLMSSWHVWAAVQMPSELSMISYLTRA